MTCINIKTKEFKTLQEATQLPSLILELKVAKWQQTNNSEVIPTESQLLNINVDTLSSYTNNESIQAIGTKEEFANFINNTSTQVGINISNELLDSFQSYVINNPIIEQIENIDTGFESVKVFEKVKEDSSIKEEIFNDDLELLAKKITDNSVRIFFNGQESSTINDVLVSIKNNADYNAETNSFIDKAIKIGGNVSVTFNNEIDENKLMAFDPQTGTIIVNKPLLSNFNSKDIAQAFLHEIAHVKTLNALIEPRNSSEKSFRDLMVKFYDEHQSFSDSYGFNSVEEMVSEIYSNSEFREEVKNIPATDEKNSIWSKILDSIRRIFGLSKTTINDRIIDRVINHVESDSINFDNIMDSPMYYAPNEVDIDSLAARVNVLNNRILDNVDQLVKMNDSARLNEYSMGVQKRGELLAELKEKLEATDVNKDVLGVYSYIDVATKISNAVLKDIKHRFNSYELNNPNSTMSIESAGFEKIEKYLSVYRLNTDIRGVLEDSIKNLRKIGNAELAKDPLQIDEIEEFKTIEDLEKVLDSFSVLDAQHRQIDALIASYRQNYVTSLLSKSSNLLPVVETKMRDIIGKEYDAKKKSNEDIGSLSRNAYINNKMKGEYAERYQKMKDDTAYDIVHNEIHNDISTYDLMWQDPLNIDNSPLIAATINIVSQMRAEIIDTARFSNRKIAELEKMYSAKYKGKPSEKYKNIYEQDSKGNYFLKGEYSVKYQSEYDKHFYSAIRKALNITKKINVTTNELNSFKGHNSTFLVRNNASEFTTGNNVNITNNSEFSKYNVKVDNVKSIQSLDNASQSDLANILSVLGYATLEQFNKSTSSLPNSNFAKNNTELYDFLKNGKSINLIQITRIKADGELRKQAFKNPSLISWITSNTVKREGKYYPKDEYKNDLSKLSSEERQVLDSFIDISKMSNTSSHKLAVTAGGAKSVTFYRLPSRNKSQREFILEGDVKGTAKAVKRSLIEVEKDDIDYGEKIDSKGQIVQTIGVHYRGEIDSDIQSLDLFTLYRDEAVNMINYDIKNKYLGKFNAIREASGAKRYAAKSSKTGKIISNMFNKRIKEQTIEGTASNEFKKISGIIEANLFDIKNYSNGKLGTADFNKILNTLNGTVASVGLTFNYISGIANVTNGFTQMFMNSLVGQNFTAKDLASAELEYTKEMPDIMADLGRPNKQARVNQMVEMFDLLGQMNPESQSYLYNTVGKKIFSRTSTGFMQDAGEHAMSGILMYAVMKGIKVTNSSGLFIDKDGNVITEDKAATLFDMIIKNEDGSYGFSDKFFGTSHSPMTNFHIASGRSQVSLLMKKRMHDMFGAYDPGMQPEVYKKAWGKTVLMFKRFLLPGLIYRYKGASTIFKDPASLTDADRNYNFSTKQFEEGYYTTALKLMVHGVYKSAKNLNFEVLSHYYAELSDMEKKNLRKAMIDLGMTALILPLLAMLLLGSIDDDDDEAWVYPIVYQVRRLQQEIAMFRNPMEASKILMNPIASARYIQNVLKATYDTVTFLNLIPEDDDPVFDWLREDREGNNALLKRYSKIIPLTSQMNKDAKQMYNLINQ